MQCHFIFNDYAVAYVVSYPFHDYECVKFVNFHLGAQKCVKNHNQKSVEKNQKSRFLKFFSDFPFSRKK